MITHQEAEMELQRAFDIESGAALNPRHRTPLGVYWYTSPQFYIYCGIAPFFFGMVTCPFFMMAGGDDPSWIVLSVGMLLIGLAFFAVAGILFGMLNKKKKKFIEDFLDDRATTAIRDRRYAAEWLWRFVEMHSRAGRMEPKYVYTRGRYEAYEHMLRWL